ncbi:MAG TPA: HK97 family phage prohead protease [Gemmatimonadales bacterium]|nr:HK97 family phage prohead protease [Gemmatimonadales bacterium]
MKIQRTVDQMSPTGQTPPRENIVRSAPGIEFTRSGESGMPTLRGHFSVFNTWTTIDSAWEGTFRERVAPGAFSKTIQENRNNIKVLFQHGKDPQVGDKPLGAISDLREDDTGAYYEVPLLDTSYNRDLLPGLEAGLYGASFRFKVLREDFDRNPERSDDNPEGLPERTIKEAALYEFGPVTFGAYPTATAGVRSLTDEYILRSIVSEPERLERLLREAGLPLAETIFTGNVEVTEALYQASNEELPEVITAPSEAAPASATQSDERREPKPNKRFKNSEDWEAWLLNS